MQFISKAMKQLSLLLALALLLFLSACATGNRIIERRGNPMLRERSFTGMSDACKDEKTAREEAVRNALSQVSLFNGVSVDYTYLAQTTEENGKLQDNSVSNVALLSKSLFRVVKFEFYTEQRKGPEGNTWQSWCYIPYSDEVRENFLSELIKLTRQGIEPAESQLSASAPATPELIISNLERVFCHYLDARKASQSWFTAPNSYTAFVEGKTNQIMQQVDAFYRELVLSASPAGVNELSFNATYKKVPYSGTVSAVEINPVSFIDTLVVTQQNDGALITISPRHSGSTNLRVAVDKDRFPGFQCYRDVSVTLQLNHLFTRKTVGLCCRDDNGGRQETATAFGKLITEVEGRIVDLSLLSADDALSTAAGKSCDYLLIAETSLSELRENPQQNLFIAFPTLSMRIIDLAKQQVIYQTGYPNATLTDIRCFGKTSSAAITEAYAFKAILTNEAFLKGFHELKK